jgi:transcription-repair coupling factor (superfamily II helicase)
MELCDNPPPVMAGPSHNPLPPPPPQPGEGRVWADLPDATAALSLVQLAREHDAPVVTVVADEHRAYRLEDEARFFAAGDLPVEHFPDWETLPYDVFSPHADIVSARLAALHTLPRGGRRLLIVAADTLLQRLPPAPYIQGRALMLHVGERLDPLAMRERLEAAGYAAVSEVRTHGEFALRGSVLDLFPMGSDTPYRLDLFDDEIEAIRGFDPETQRSTDRIESVRLLPAREFPLDEDGVKGFRQRYRARFAGDPAASLIYREVSRGVPPGGIEYYLPLFFDATAGFFDYLPAGALIAEIGDVPVALERARAEIEDRYEQRRVDPERPLLAPDEAFHEAAGAAAHLRETGALRLADDDGDAVRFAAEPVPDLGGADEAETGRRLLAFLQEFKGRVLVVGDSAGRREALRDWLRRLGLHPERTDSWPDFLAGDGRLAVTAAPLETGCILSGAGIAIVAEAQLTGDKPPVRRRRAARDPEAAIRDLADLAEGAPVVHADHGVGRYRGLRRLAAGGYETEFLTLEYADGDKLYVPVASLHLISRFTGADAETAPLHKLGGDRWVKTRRRAAERARDVAAELLEIQARRAARPGVSFRIDEAEYRRFCNGFPFTETPDQARAIEQVLEDLAGTKPMDRVVCGDVGFGKTEVALRSAFVAACNGYQVCVLAPTTLLVQQHYQTFADRFADWPVKIGSLSRLRARKERDKLVAEMAKGTLDIVIGTHRLLGDDIRFKNLGLLVIDEEHRFGVRHKERIKQLRAQVDMLTLTATPIPRTLNMGLAGLRDLSIIATPPEQRLAIQTFVARRDASLIREACRRELRRGGQIYYLHNEVRDIERVARELTEIVPGAKLRIAHGQMRERDLEQTMLDFYHRRFDLLLCTTIIESGIDVPSANTMIVDRADKFGLAQLHQLRGRVGRSHHRAYAYLLTPPPEALTADARKRLDAIASLGDLGAGFTLATHDLEIRGAGELLGEEQSGQIQEVGFDLYQQLLTRAVAAYKRGELPDTGADVTRSAEVDLSASALLPEDYIPDVHMRLVLYKRISAADSDAALRELKVELIDRFGLLPEPAENLFAATGIKLRATPLGITKIEAGPDIGRLHFAKHTAIDPAALIELVQGDPRSYRLEGGRRLTLFREMPDVETRLTAVTDILARLSTSTETTATNTEHQVS